MIAGFVLLISPFLYGLKKHSFCHSLAVIFFALCSKALAKNIWQGAGEVECLIVFLFACAFFFKDGEKQNSLRGKMKSF